MAGLENGVIKYHIYFKRLTEKSQIHIVLKVLNENNKHPIDSWLAHWLIKPNDNRRIFSNDI